MTLESDKKQQKDEKPTSTKSDEVKPKSEKMSKERAARFVANGPEDW